MDWNNFKSKFHKSWHPYIRKFIESKQCDNIYKFLKKQTNEIAPKSTLTFRSFEQDLNEIKVVVMFDEPYSDKKGDIQYADGIPLSCEYVDKMHTHLNTFWNAMEKEFYDLNLNMEKTNHLNFLTNQGVMFTSSSLTTEINAPGKHSNIWLSFNKYIIKEIFIKRNIPIVFVGENVLEQYRNILPPIFPYFFIKQAISDVKIGVPWKTENVFTRVNSYLYNNTVHEDVQWVNLGLPF